VRVDLTDPDVRFLPTPRSPTWPSPETLAYSVSNYLKIHGLQVAVNCNFHSAPDSGPEGAAGSVKGLLISTNTLVSPVGDERYASLLFTSNKEPIMLFNNVPPGTNTSNIYAAVSGYYPVLSNGVNIGDASINAYPGGPHDANPRTAYGISQDKRYLYLMVIDGRREYDGALDKDTADWLLHFGAWDGINMDGGGSTTLDMQDCAGNPVPLNNSSFVRGYGKERVIGAHFGVYAAPLPVFIYNVAVTPGATAATITWNTSTNATTQLEYGTTQNFGSFSPLDGTPVTNHSVTLSGLIPGVKYFFRVLSQAGGSQYSSACAGNNSFAVGVSSLFSLTNDWKFSTNNLDGVNWKSIVYDDSSWTNHGPAPLWADSRVPATMGTNFSIPNITSGTRMPINPATTYAFITYYFRTWFNLPGSPAGVTLMFSNFLDDGAVFYLNGFEIFRTNLPAAQTITNSTPATAVACSGNNATCPIMFTLSGNVLSNLVAGLNLLAVELHNTGANGPDATFESALSVIAPPPPPQIITNLLATPGETNVTITWTTSSNATTQVQFGPTPALGSSNALNGTLTTSHSVTLIDLRPATLYYFRVLSQSGSNTFFVDGTFTTTSLYVPLVSATNIWKFTTNNLDGSNWMARTYNDSTWPGQGTALLYIEDNTSISPRTTPLPAANNGQPFPTYYFRTHFTVTNSLAGMSLLFTPFIDDGAVFYLNGTEIRRVRMLPAPQPITYTTLSYDCPPNDCDTGLDAPDVFRLSGSMLTNVLVGSDNVLAVEVHQFMTNDTDVVFGSNLGLVRAFVNETSLRASRSNNMVCLSWDGLGFTLQQANTLIGSNAWSDVPGPVRFSPYCTTNPPTATFYRLRN
jgi:hypothetical protein